MTEKHFIPKELKKNVSESIIRYKKHSISILQTFLVCSECLKDVFRNVDAH